MSDDKPKQTNRDVRGYCRVCWKAFFIYMNVRGMDRAGILEAVGKRFHCCSKPDLRLNA